MNLATLSDSFAKIPIDWIVIGVFTILLMIDALRSGTRRTSALALALPITLFLFSTLSHTSILDSIVGRLTTPPLQTILFALLFIIVIVLVHRMLYSFGESASPLRAILAGVAAAIVSIVTWLQVPALQSMWHFSSLIQTVFGAAYALWWLLFAYFTLAFVRS